MADTIYCRPMVSAECRSRLVNAELGLVRRLLTTSVDIDRLVCHRHDLSYDGFTLKLDRPGVAYDLGDLVYELMFYKKNST